MNLETKDIIKEEIEHKIKCCSNEIQDYLEIELNKSKETLLNQWLEIKRLNNRIDKAIEYIENNYPVCAGSELLDILKGSDNNDK